MQERNKHIQHKRGHNWQLMSMGLFEYTFRIVISSIIYNDYNAPWELFADLIGGVQEKKNSANNNFILIFSSCTR